MRDEEREMLSVLGVDSVEGLFLDIPGGVRRPLNLPDGMSESDVFSLFKEILGVNRTFVEMPFFAGVEQSPRFVPPAVDYIVSRGEFLTSYTSYQPEISQGLLQGLFEYQSLMSELTGMEVVNASLYDWSTALGEALRMAHRINRRRFFVLPDFIPHWRKDVARLYVEGFGGELLFFPHETEGSGSSGVSGGLNLDALSAVLEKRKGDVSAVYVEMPNFFGVVDRQIMELKDLFPDVLLVVGVDPISLGVLVPPGDYGADIVVGEGQNLGLPPGFGGPGLGIFATTKKYVRKMPGRLVGATVDAEGRRAFSITLQTREQHIRRERATSNICSNEALCALAAGVYLALLGKSGLRDLCDLLVHRAHVLADMLSGLDGVVAPVFSGPFFSSFVAEFPVDYACVHRFLLSRGVHGGFPLSVPAAPGVAPGTPGVSPPGVSSIPSARLSGPSDARRAVFAVNEYTGEREFSVLVSALREFLGAEGGGSGV